MKRLQRDSVIISLIEALRDRGSWCGETHVQKATYFLQELLGVPLGFQFILYKHGPYSFDLGDGLAQMEADYMIKPIPRSPYGASLDLGETSDLLKAKFPKTIAMHMVAVNFVAEKLAGKNVGDLERVATAMYVSREPDAKKGARERAARIHELKPHVSMNQALNAVNESDKIKTDAQELPRNSKDIIEKDNKPFGKEKRIPGLNRGEIWVSDDFDDPLALKGEKP